MNGAKPTAIDPDFDYASPVTYSVVEDPEGYFDIDPSNGELTYVGEGELDRECSSCNWREGYYPLTLRAEDNVGYLVKP